MYQIDLLYWIPLSLLAIAILSAIMKRAVNIWIGLMGIALGALITWYASPYTQYAIMPIRNYLFYGASFTWETGVAMAHVISLVFMSLVAIFNLWSSKGYSLWLMVMPQAKAGRSFRAIASDINTDNYGALGTLAILAIVGILTAGTVAGWGIYRFLQSPNITYNITNPPESAYPSIFSVGGTGININLIIIAIAGLIVLYLIYRLSKQG